MFVKNDLVIMNLIIMESSILMSLHGRMFSPPQKPKINSAAARRMFYGGGDGVYT